MNREIEKLREEEAETKWARADGEIKKDGKMRVDIAQCSLITRAAEVQEPDMSNPVDTRGRAMGSHGMEGEDIQHCTHRRLMCFPAIYKPIKKGHGLWASLKTNQGIGGQKFIWHCHNTAAWQHSLTTSTVSQVGQLFFFPYSHAWYVSKDLYFIYRGSLCLQHELTPTEKNEKCQTVFHLDVLCFIQTRLP